MVKKTVKTPCIVCGSTEFTSVLHIAHAPRSVQHLLKKSECSTDSSIDMIVRQCTRCRLVQLDHPYLTETYYDDYLMTRNYSEFLNTYQKGMAKHFVSEYGLKGKKILDVGCGDGYFVKYLRDSGADALGVEPSSAGCRKCKDLGVPVVQGYVDSALKLPHIFDAFVSCQVFEHLWEPNVVLANTARFLNEGAIGMIEIPSLNKSIYDHRFYDFFSDHVAYYTPTSLSYLAERNGFQVLRVSHEANGEYLVGILRYAPKQKIKHLQAMYESEVSELRAFFSQLSYSRVAVWGAGGKGIASLAHIGMVPKNIQYCVDTDPNKHGKYLPSSHVQVYAPEMLTTEPVDAVVITAMMYRDEIIDTLVSKYGFTKKQIAVLSPHPHFLDK